MIDKRGAKLRALKNPFCSIRGGHVRVSSVLVVDDCAVTLAAAKLELGDRYVFAAQTAEEARTHAADEDLQLAIIDQRLGRGTLFSAGLALVGELKQMRSNLIVASVTALLTDEGERCARTLGADFLLEKVEDEKGCCWIPVSAILDYVERNIPLPDRVPPAARTIQRVKREHVVDVMRHCNGNSSAAAIRLRISRATIVRTLDQRKRQG